MTNAGALVPRKRRTRSSRHPTPWRPRRQFLDDGSVTSIEGKRVKVRARSILVHSDTPGAIRTRPHRPLCRRIRGGVGE